LVDFEKELKDLEKMQNEQFLTNKLLKEEN
jgi:hypothetical protein